MENRITKDLKWIFIFLGLLLIFVRYSESIHVFPKHINTEHYLRIQNDMISAIRNHFTQEHQRLDSLEEQLKRWISWRKSYSGIEDEYIRVPQNLIHLFKNMTLDLQYVENMMMVNGYNDAMAKVDVDVPTNLHLENIIVSLVNLQHTYHLKPENIIRGELMGHRVNISLPVETCLLIGETCSKYNEHKCVVDWLNATILHTSNQEHLKKMYRLMYKSHLFLNDTEQAYTFAELYSNADSFDIPSNDVTISLGEQLGKVNDLHHIILESNKLCRGDYKQFLPAQNLRCRYNHENSAFLKIAPVKEEELYDHPKILLYHNVVYESEINTIKSVSKDELKTSTGYASGNKTPVTAFLYRMSQTAFVNNELPELSFFSRRIEDISDLVLKHYETLQVVNYAPGGFYRVHTDYLPPHEDYLGKSGNRIATVLFYLNDVPLGGETVFPRIKLSVNPEKGSALIWHNMLPDGSVNLLTYHSACPVIIGEKWIITQWIRAKDQKCLRRIYPSWRHTSSDESTEDQ